MKSIIIAVLAFLLVSSPINASKSQEAEERSLRKRLVGEVILDYYYNQFDVQKSSLSATQVARSAPVFSRQQLKGLESGQGQLLTTFADETLSAYTSTITITTPKATLQISGITPTATSFDVIGTGVLAGCSEGKAYIIPPSQGAPFSLRTVFQC